MATVTARKPRRRVAAKPEPVPVAEFDRAPTESDEYWTSTRRPFVCLVFLAPLLIAYEIGVLWLGDGREELLRNGADTWMRSWLYAAGVQNSFALPLVVMALLLLWNFYGYLRWRVRPETLGGMLAESLIFAFALVVAGQASELACRQAGLPTAAIEQASGSPPLGADETKLDAEARRVVARAVTFVGAGVYEEVLFRLLLLPACYGWFRLLQAGPKASAALAVVATSLMFALAHYVGPAGDTLVPYTFCFRAAAGAFFAVLFVTRGFGITVGTHAAYDLIVGVLWA
ncbi:MAG: CPBP family intramembrane glutamic endopeptidase [Planctomycetaceae bacterium]